MENNLKAFLKVELQDSRVACFRDGLGELHQVPRQYTCESENQRLLPLGAVDGGVARAYDRLVINDPIWVLLPDSTSTNQKWRLVSKSQLVWLDLTSALDRVAKERGSEPRYVKRGWHPDDHYYVGGEALGKIEFRKEDATYVGYFRKRPDHNWVPTSSYSRSNTDRSQVVRAVEARCNPAGPGEDTEGWLTVPDHLQEPMKKFLNLEKEVSTPGTGDIEVLALEGGLALTQFKSPIRLQPNDVIKALGSSYYVSSGAGPLEVTIGTSDVRYRQTIHLRKI